MLVKIKELDQRTVFERPTTTVNELNEPVGAWEEAFPAWAKVRPLRPSDVVAADHPWATGSYSFIVRSCGQTNALTGTSGHRILWSGQHYYPVGEPMRLDGPKGFLMITATSVKVNDV